MIHTQPCGRAAAPSRGRGDTSAMSLDMQSRPVAAEKRRGGGMSYACVRGAAMREEMGPPTTGRWVVLVGSSGGSRSACHDMAKGHSPLAYSVLMSVPCDLCAIEPGPSGEMNTR